MSYTGHWSRDALLQNFSVPVLWAKQSPHWKVLLYFNLLSTKPNIWTRIHVIRVKNKGHKQSDIQVNIFPPRFLVSSSLMFPQFLVRWWMALNTRYKSWRFQEKHLLLYHGHVALPGRTCLGPLVFCRDFKVSVEGERQKTWSCINITK